MKKNKNKSPLILRLLTTLVVIFLVLTIGCTVAVNWLELESRKANTAPAVFGWSFVSLNETYADESLTNGDLILVTEPEAYEEGMMVLCRDIKTDVFTADDRFALARITFIRDGKFGLSPLTNGERTGLIAEADVLLGEARYSIAWLGWLFGFMRTPIGFFSLILGPAALLLILILIRAIIAFVRHRRAQAEEEAAEEAEAQEEPLAVSETEETSLLNHDIELSEETEPLIGKETPEKAPEAAPEEKPAEEPAKAEEPVEKTPVTAEAEIASPIEPAAAQEKPVEEPKAESKAEETSKAKQDASRQVDEWLSTFIMEKPAEEPKSVPAEKPKAPSFSSMSTNDILEQFRLELEEARYKTLSEEEKEE